MDDPRLNHVEEDGYAVEAADAVNVGVEGFEEHEEALGDVKGCKDDEDEFVRNRGEGGAEVIEVESWHEFGRWAGGASSDVVLDAGVGVEGDDVVNSLAACDEAVLRSVGFGGNDWRDGAVGDGGHRFVVGVFQAKGSGVLGGSVGAFGGVFVG